MGQFSINPKRDPELAKKPAQLSAAKSAHYYDGGKALDVSLPGPFHFSEGQRRHRSEFESFLATGEGIGYGSRKKSQNSICDYRHRGGKQIAGAAQYRSDAGHGMGRREGAARAGFRGGRGAARNSH